MRVIHVSSLSASPATAVVQYTLHWSNLRYSTVETSRLKFWSVVKCQDVRTLFLIHLLSDPELLVLVSHEVCQDCPSQEHHVLSPRRIFYPDFNPVKLLYLRPCTEGFSFLWMIKKNLGYMHSKVIKTSLQNFPSLSSRTRNTESLGSGLVSVSESASIFKGVLDSVSDSESNFSGGG